MQVIFAYTVLFLAGFVCLVFLAVPRLRRHALKAAAAVFGFFACSLGSYLVFIVGISGHTEATLPAWANGVTFVILANVIFWVGGIAGAWLAFRAIGWVQAQVREEWKRF